MDALQAEYLRELVFNRQHDRWRQVEQCGGFASGRLLNRLRGAAEVEALIILEHPIVDDESMLCEGTPLAGWRLNTFGLCEISVGSFERLRWADNRWPFELVRFAMDLGDAPIVYINEFTCADRGNLLRCEAVRTRAGLKLNIAEKRKHRPAKPQAAPSEPAVSSQAALAFIRGGDRAMPA